MAGGRFDSSKTRVKPVFDQLWSSGRDWLPQLLSLASDGCSDPEIGERNLKLLEGYWEPNEKCVDPPVSLLSWLIRNLGALDAPVAPHSARSRLAAGDPSQTVSALTLLRTEGSSRGWHILEGPTCPDALLISADAIVVIEGKRTEATVTTDTTWLKGRHQIWRHIDAAWEIRGRRSVYGMLIVESDPAASAAAVPEHWLAATRNCLDATVLRSSFPHRSADEAQATSKCFLGVTTWRHVCEHFELDWRALPHDISVPSAPPPGAS